MRLTSLSILFSLVHTFVSAQYYFTGEVQDLHGDKLQHVFITIQSTGSIFQTGQAGNFEITSRQADDTVTFSFEGYDHYTTVIHSSENLQVILRPQRLPLGSAKEAMRSSIKGPMTVSFAGNSNGVSYHTVKRFLDMGYSVPAEAVKIEEMLGYFNTLYEPPAASEQFFCSSHELTCPWNNAHRLLLVNISGRKVNVDRTPPANLVFLIDVSGSMDMPNKLPLIKASLRPLIRNLRETDTVSIVQYGAGMRVMSGIPGSKKDAIIGAIEQLEADGNAPGDEGLRLAYRVARRQFIPGGNNRILFVTDGDISNERTEASDLADYIGEQSTAGIRLSCIGVGLDDSADSQLPLLAGRGQGQFTGIRSEEEGERALLKEWTADGGCIADHVCITADFDTTRVSGYRLIGYDNRDAASDNNRDASLPDTTISLEGRSIASAHALMAVFEVTPRKDTAGTIARVRVDYCMPGQAAKRSMSYDCANKLLSFDKASVCLRKATCVAMFGMKLKGPGINGETVSWQDIQRIAKAAFTGNNYIDREYLTLVARARKIYETKDDRSASHE